MYFVYDIKVGNLFCFWRGFFVDVIFMWNNCGDGLFWLRGVVNYLFIGYFFGILVDENVVFFIGLDE